VINQTRPDRTSPPATTPSPVPRIRRDRTGVGAGTVYRHFPTKESLYQAIVADRVQHIVDTAPPPPSPA